MNLDKLQAFLVEANKYTYSTGNESLNSKEQDGSTTIIYQKGDWKYHDNFFGGEPYGGREVVSFNEKPIWLMVYYGSIDVATQPETVYPILQKALRAMPTESPFRGPHEMKDGEYIYHNVWVGTIEKFTGKEIISKNGKEIYRAHYMGGLVDIKR